MMSTVSSERPTRKLSVAFAGMCLMAVDHACTELGKHDLGWGWALWELATTSFYIWLAWFGIFRTAVLQLLWGWPCLLVGFGGLGVAALDWLGVSEPSKSMPLGILAMPVTGWLLVIDRDVARYRTHLRKLEDARCKLRLED